MANHYKNYGADSNSNSSVAAFIRALEEREAKAKAREKDEAKKAVYVGTALYAVASAFVLGMRLTERKYKDEATRKAAETAAQEAAQEARREAAEAQETLAANIAQQVFRAIRSATLLTPEQQQALEEALKRQQA
jgi:hypothetical protein